MPNFYYLQKNLPLIVIFEKELCFRKLNCHLQGKRTAVREAESRYHISFFYLLSGTFYFYAVKSGHFQPRFCSCARHLIMAVAVAIQERNKN